ncbi:hypothetical protein [Paenibacillus cineris]|uniref:Uncharacterized protein n=1 Tax=Paenibacillus cineris TaxID=237530 RepID=A0ABQ4LN28_9BACL|nr:hypothetical protein [Paenibacillus cineris]GIO57924.1 hypothetical protein J21TS7_62420 [Paenibacillus cineris]
MKIEKVPVDLNGVTRHLVYDLNAHYDLEKMYGSPSKLIEEIKKESTGSIPYILQVGLAHEEDIPIEALDLLVNLGNVKYLTYKILQALTAEMPDTSKYKSIQSQHQPPSGDSDGGWPWDWMYYIGTVQLGMSEAVFWRSTPKKLFALWEIHKKYNGIGAPGEQQQANPDTPPAWVDQYI